MKSKLQLITVILLATLCVAQTPAPLTPTQDQLKDLQIAQLRAQLAQTQAQRSADILQAALANLKGVCKSVVIENKWPKEADCNPDTLVFSTPPAPPVMKKPEVK